MRFFVMLNELMQVKSSEQCRAHKSKTVTNIILDLHLLFPFLFHPHLQPLFFPKHAFTGVKADLRAKMTWPSP